MSTTTSKPDTAERNADGAELSAATATAVDSIENGNSEGRRESKPETPAKGDRSSTDSKTKEARKDESADAGAMATSFLKNMGQVLQRSSNEGGRHRERSEDARRHSRSGRSPGRRSPSRRSPSRRRSPSKSRGRRSDYEPRRSGRDDSRSYRRRSRSSSRHRRRSRDNSRRRSRRDETPVVPLHLRPKRLQMWDLAPPGFENVSCMDAKASGMFPPPGQAAGSRNVASFNPSVLFEHTHREENDRFRPSSRGEREFPSTASRQARRLYVGNMPYGIDEDGIAAFFNDLMVRMNIAPADELPVQNIQINYDKNYAFVEFRDADQATMGMGLDGVMFQNQKLKIRRPKDYIPPVGQTEPKPPVLNVPGVVSNTVPDTPNKVYIGGLPTYLTEPQVMELLHAFGELKSFNLVKDNVSKMSRGFAFCEYMDPSVTDIACQGLNGMELADRRLVVQRASVGARGGAGAQTAGHHNQSQHHGHNHGNYQQQQQHGQSQHHAYGMPTHEQSYQQPPGLGANNTHHPPPPPPHLAGIPAGLDGQSAQPTRIVQLLNMVTVAELSNDEEYEDIVEDVRDECLNYGAVEDLLIPRQDPDQPETKVPGVGKIFIKYSTPEEATQALNALAGRQFMGRTVVATYITETDFESKNY